MPDWLGFAVIVTAIGGVFWFLSRLLQRSQAGDASKRGQDASQPGGFYSDDHPGGSD